MNFTRPANHERSTKMFMDNENYIPEAELDQIQALIEFGYQVEIPQFDGKRDIIFEGVPTSLKNIGLRRRDNKEYNAPSLISNLERDIKDEVLKKYLVQYDFLISHKGKMLKDIIEYNEIKDFYKYLCFDGNINGLYKYQAKQILLSGNFYTRHYNKKIHYGFIIKDNDEVNLKKMFNCLKIDSTTKLGLRINKNQLKNEFKFDLKKMTDNHNIIIGL